MTTFLLIIMWVTLTYFVFKTAKAHNIKTEFKCLKVSWEPYIISLGVLFLIMLRN